MSLRNCCNFTLRDHPAAEVVFLVSVMDLNLLDCFANVSSHLKPACCPKSAFIYAMAMREHDFQVAPGLGGSLNSSLLKPVRRFSIIWLYAVF